MTAKIKSTCSCNLRMAGCDETANQCGQSAVEIALILPLLLLILFGIIMSGFLFYAYIQVSNAAREGARAGSLYRDVMGNTTDSLSDVVQNAVYYSSTLTALGGLPATSSNPGVTVEYGVNSINSSNPACSITNPCAGDLITATVTYSYTQPILSAFLPVFPQPLIIVRNVRMEMQ